MNDDEDNIRVHPMELMFDLEEGSTLPTTIPREPTVLAKHDEFDEKDEEIEEQFQEVYDLAIEAYETQAADAEVIEPKYRARTQEIAAQFLGAALNAAKEKSSLKAHKDKMSVNKIKASGPQTLNQNLIVADRNDLLKHLAGINDEKE